MVQFKLQVIMMYWIKVLAINIWIFLKMVAGFLLLSPAIIVGGLLWIICILVVGTISLPFIIMEWILIKLDNWLVGTEQDSHDLISAIPIKAIIHMFL